MYESQKMKLRELDPRFLVVAASLLLSGYTLLFPDLINDDAYTYVRTAEVYLEQGLAAALRNYSWPFYSIVMATLSQLTGIGFFTSGLLINAAFFALLSYSFVSIVRLLNPSLLAQYLAALSILVYPQLNEYRYLIIRDIGFWALVLFSLGQFIQYIDSQQRNKLLAFTFALVLATGFRAESLVFLFTLPFALLFSDNASREIRRARFFDAYAIITTILLLLYSVFWLLGFNIGRQLFGFLFTYLPFFQEFFGYNEQLRFEQSVTLFSEYAASYSQRYLGLFMTAGFLAILLATLIKGIGVPYLMLLAYGGVKRLLPISRNYFPAVAITLVSNLVILLGFIAVTRFLSSRYTMMFALVAVIFVPLVLESVIARIRDSGSIGNLRTAKILLSIFFAYCLIDAYYSFGERKDYIASASEWILMNSEDSTNLLTNNHAIAYESNKVDAYDQIQRTLSLESIEQVTSGTLIVIENYQAMTDVVDQMLARNLATELVTFSDSERPRISIYRRN